MDDMDPDRNGRAGDRPPRLVSADEAARYLGVSRSTFRCEVDAGLWPPPFRRGQRERRVTWDVRALDRACDLRSGLLVGASGDQRAAGGAAAVGESELIRRLRTR